MSFSHQHTIAHNHRLSPPDRSTFSPLDQVPSTFNRSILGIPAEDDEFTRGLTFFVDPSTGQPSVYSTSEESDDPLETPPYEPSQSSNNTSSRKVNTPQSTSDASAGLQPWVASPRSVGSSGNESLDSGADQLHPPSVSVRSSFDASEAEPSPRSFQKPGNLSIEENSAATMLSPTAGLPDSERFDLLRGMPDPQTTLRLEPNDFKCLEEIMGIDDGSRLMALEGPQNKQSFGLPHPNLAQGSKPTYEETFRKTGTDTTAIVARTPRASRPRPNPMEPRVSTKDTKDRAKWIEKVKLMRRIGVCLPCLVNHEPVSG